ncbi:MAG: ROK family protein [Myxococcales bacterium]|nr:ROK family protein [Myxococcales bacterium]
MKPRYCLGFDIGGSTFRVGVVAAGHDENRCVDFFSTPLLPEDRPPALLAAKIAEMAEGVSRQWGPLDHVGIALAAQLTKGGEISIGAPNLNSPDADWADVPVTELFRRYVLADHLDPPSLSVMNDLNAILCGEHRAGAAVGEEDVLAFYLGTGLGGAVLADGRILEGSGGLAGEVGHLKRPVALGEPIRCGCGQENCLETLVGGRYLPEQYRRHGGSAREVELTAAEIDRRAAGGEAAALGLWSQIVDELGHVVSAAVAMTNPGTVLFGGGVLQNSPTLFSMLTRRILNEGASILSPHFGVRLGTLGDQAGVIGAALWA